MRHIVRKALNQAETDTLKRLTDSVNTADDPKAEAKRRWKSKPKAKFAKIRALLEEMAPGRTRCMYCEDSRATDIEHFWPKSLFPARAFTWENYLLACSHCNSNLKRDRFPLDDAEQPLLIDPTADDPAEHLLFLPGDGTFDFNTPKGEASIDVFGLNDDTRRRLPAGRKDALVSLTSMLIRYDILSTNDDPRAAETREAILRHPFSSMLTWLISISDSANAEIILGEDVVAAITTHRVSDWQVD